jgi:hypothetical protein
MAQIYDPVSGTYVDDGTGSSIGNDVASTVGPGVGYGPSLTGGVDFYQAASAPIPDATALPLPGQLPGIPGGGASNGSNMVSDPSGINVVHLNPSVNPTPTGGYMSTAAAVLSAASTGFSTYVKGSPSVAIPPPKVPAGGIFSSVLGGSTNWMVIGIVVVAGLGIMVFLAARA